MIIRNCTTTQILFHYLVGIPKTEGFQVSGFRGRKTEDGRIPGYREGENTILLTQNALDDFRPYIHPILSRDGKGILTEYSPGHHKHQTHLLDAQGKAVLEETQTWTMHEEDGLSTLLIRKFWI
jgi:hypothetical protein